MLKSKEKIVRAKYNIKFSDEETSEEFELTTFRKESYRKGGTHTPEKIEFTTDIVEDAKRRDFKINAIYYDIKEDKIAELFGV